MTRILLDECLPIKLKYIFQEIDKDFLVSTVTDQLWAGIKNGELLEQAQKQFDVLVTVDQNLPYQQELSKYSIVVIALKAKSNRYKDLLGFVEHVCEVIKSAESGHYYEINPQSM